MLYQTDPALNLKSDVHYHYACYLLSNLYYAEQALGKTFTAQDILQTIEWNVAHGNVDAEDTVLNVNALHKSVGSPYRQKLLNPKDKNSVAFPPDYVPQGNEVEILCLHRENPTFTHFVVGSGVTPLPSEPWQKEIIFDPIAGGSLTAKLGYLLSKRILYIPT